MNATSPNVTYCDLKDVRNAFSPYYTYLSLIICVFGSVTNVLNICVLTTKQMRCPTNMILTALALANLLVMLEYIPFVFLFNDGRKFAWHYTYNLAVFVIFHALFTQAFHFISCVLAVLLAIWQYIAVKYPQNNNKLCSNVRTKITLTCTFLLCPLVCIPLKMSLKIVKKPVSITETGEMLPRPAPNSSNTTVFVSDYKSEYLQNLSSYIYSFVIKLIPCILLTVLSCLLIVELVRAKERRENLMKPKTEETIKMRKPSQRFLEKEKQLDRTTRMLLAVLLLFLMVELPQAILGLLNVVIGKAFELQCYQMLGDIVDVLTLTNSSINFILYCIMSKKFRSAFKECFFPYIPCSKISKGSWIDLQTLQTNTVESYV
ncbi:G-protein coupled receptor dmsr-1-like [Tenebrio molitor]|jgi:Ca2+/Na+ antiporter|uniref:G-protein coupled receptor dmsr-1-like n=1 Tax=Tenebrio molitor TaxID=7067 RepID=UPI00362480F0